MPSLTDDPFGKDRWWIRRNSPGTFFGTIPKGEIQNGDSGGDWKGPASRRASSSFLSFASTAEGFSRADNKLLAVRDLRSPWKWIEKPWVKPDIKNSTVEWVYPSSKKPNLSTLTGVGRSGGLGLGRLGLKTRCSGWATKITIWNRVWPITFIALVFVCTGRGTFTALVESETVSFGGVFNPTR